VDFERERLDSFQRWNPKKLLLKVELHPHQSCSCSMHITNDVTARNDVYL